MLNTYGEYYVIVTAIIIISLTKLLITPEKPSILNIYRTPSTLYWVKVGVLYIILRVRKLIKAVVSREVKELYTDENAIDGVYFASSSIQGDRFCINISQRNDNKIETYTTIKIPFFDGILLHVNNPDTFLNKEKNDEKGFNVFCVVPTKKWKITYNGQMKNVKDEKLHSVCLNLNFSSKFPVFNYNTDSDDFLYAKSIALELWNIEYLNILKEFDLLRLGQFGKLEGKMSIDGEEFEVSMNSYCNRILAKNFNWSTYHRFVVHYINVKNGDRFVIGKVSQPIVISNFSQGFMYCASDKTYYPLQSCNFELYQHGETEEPPIDYAFSFSAGGREYTVQINVEDSVTCFLGENWECKLLERYCTASVNGTQAWGSCQWLYRNIYGKHV